jgi:CRP/FNR family cyclic AMP-dependent transcriptional regulator
MEPVIQFAKKYPRKHYNRGEIIIWQEDEPEFAHIVSAGLVKCYNISADGLEQPIAFNGPGDTFPIAWVFHQLNVSEFFYGAYTDCDVYRVPRADLVGFLKADPSALFDLTSALAADYQAAMQRMRSLEYSKAQDKIMHTLLYLSKHFSEPGTRNGSLMMPITQQELANFVGLTRETTATILKHLKRDRAIDYYKSQIQVFPERLSQLAEV